jgi:hypothetical protein
MAAPDLAPRADRLAQLVAHLSDCSPRRAVDAVDAVIDLTDDPMEVVARALCQVRRPAPVDLRDRTAADIAR